MWVDPPPPPIPPPFPEGGVNRWEYHILFRSLWGVWPQNALGEIQTLGNQGWEMVTLSADYAVFKRQR